MSNQRHNLSFFYIFFNILLTTLKICRIINMVIDHITSHKFSIPFYTIVERWIPAIFLFLYIKKDFDIYSKPLIIQHNTT